MIKVGERRKVGCWGEYTVRKLARLKRPVECQSKEIGTALFNPILLQIEWDNPPSDDKHELWFRYYIAVGVKEKYSQFPPILGEKALLELLQNATHQGFFSEDFLRGLNKTITGYLET